MRRKWNVWLPTAALAVLSPLGYAQYGPAGSPYQPESVDRLVEQVNVDLNHGYDKWHLSNGDRDRLNRAEKKLRGFAKDWEHARFDKGDLDDSIASIQHVLDNNHLDGPERDALSSDVTKLRALREAYDRHEIGRWQ